MIKKQGITVTVLVITIIVLTILTGTITISTISTMGYSKLSSWINEISYIQDVVEEEKSSSSSMDYTMQEIILNISLEADEEQFEGETIGDNNTIVLKILDLGKLKITNTMYGNLDTSTDVYAVSETTGKVYYVQGIEIDGKTYYSLTDSLRQRFNLATSSNQLSSVVFVPSVVGYSNEPITVLVKIPKTYTNIQITTSNTQIQIGAQTEKESTYEYTINTNKVAGNYVVTANYNNGTQTLTTKYEVNGYDVTPPVITPLDYYSMVYKETETETLDYITNISATDESGIKIMKYELGEIQSENAQTYFENNGNIISNGKINLDRKTTIYTIYAEDNAGNFSILTFDKKDVMPEEWKTNVSYIYNSVPIPKGFVASQATGENAKNGGLVIYEGTAAVTDVNVEDAKRNRNQYVWVPVSRETFVTSFVRKRYTYSVFDQEGKYYALGANERFWETMVNEVTNLPLQTLEEQNAEYMSPETLEEVQAMYASVKKYGGFYMARYEAGIDSTRKSVSETLITGKNVHSKLGKKPYNFITWCQSDSMNIDSGGVVQVARSLYPNDSTNITGVISTLPYSVQWDVTIQWYIDTGIVALEQVNGTTGSVEFGNYKNHIIQTPEYLNDDSLVWVFESANNVSFVEKDSETLTYPKENEAAWVLSTGALKAAKLNNIYDMAGNLLEWTMEGYSTDNRVARGGYFFVNGNDWSIAERGSNTTYKGYYHHYGFRTALYIKLPTT